MDRPATCRRVAQSASFEGECSNPLRPRTPAMDPAADASARSFGRAFLVMEMIPGFYFDPARLKDLSARTRDDFINARPFPHVVIDGFMDPEILGRVADEFPGPDDPAWEMWGPGPVKHSRDRRIEKLGLSAEDGFGPLTDGSSPTG